MSRAFVNEDNAAAQVDQPVERQVLLVLGVTLQLLSRRRRLSAAALA